MLPADNTPQNPESPSPEVQKAKQASHQAAVATELPFLLVSAVVAGGRLGYFLDRWLHTKPVFLLVLGGIGCYAGGRDGFRGLGGSGDELKGIWGAGRGSRRAALLPGDRSDRSCRPTLLRSV